jgi:hypothetical protein
MGRPRPDRRPAGAWSRPPPTGTGCGAGGLPARLAVRVQVRPRVPGGQRAVPPAVGVLGPAVAGDAATGGLRSGRGLAHRGLLSRMNRRLAACHCRRSTPARGHARPVAVRHESQDEQWARSARYSTGASGCTVRAFMAAPPGGAGRGGAAPGTGRTRCHPPRGLRFRKAPCASRTNQRLTHGLCCGAGYAYGRSRRLHPVVHPPGPFARSPGFIRGATVEALYTPVHT